MFTKDNTFELNDGQTLTTITLKEGIPVYGVKVSQKHIVYCDANQLWKIQTSDGLVYKKTTELKWADKIASFTVMDPILNVPKKKYLAICSVGMLEASNKEWVYNRSGDMIVSGVMMPSLKDDDLKFLNLSDILLNSLNE